MRFSEFHDAQTIELGPISVDARQIVEFAQAYDPQWFHTDPVRAEQGRWNGLIASGWQTCALAMKLVVQELLSDSESFGSPGLSYLKWTAPVRPDDKLRLRLTVLEYQGSDSARVAMRYAVHHVEASVLAGLRGVGAVALAEEDDGDHGGSTGRRRRRALAAEQSGRWGFGFGPMRGALPWCEFVQQGIQGGDLFRRLTTELPVSRGCNRPPWPRSRC